MQEVIERALFTAKKLGATYADVRLIEREAEDITVSNGKVEGVKKRLTKGFGVRVIVNGAWGFFSSYNVSPEEGEYVAFNAVQIAKASAMTKIEDARLAQVEIYQDKVLQPVKIDPFSIPLNKKIDFMLSLDKLMEKPGIIVRSSSMHFSKEWKTFASLEGAFIEQERIVSGAGLQAIATDGKEIQIRSYPASFGGNYARKGYEFIEEMKLEENAERIRDEALLLLKAKPAPSGIMDLIIGPYQMALQLHESVGHPTELDRVLGEEASFAGTSFLTPEKLGNFQFGSKYVNIVADATVPDALGGFAYDDEGVKAKKIYLVKEGLFVGYLNSRETAFKLGLEPMGAMRADGWNRQPIIRMTSINLEPGNMTLEELIAGVNEGLLIDVNRSWSIDQKRLNFQFGTEIGYEIKNGKIQDMVKNPTYSGITYEFWRSLDGVGNESYYKILGVPNCGKGEPMQVMEVSHGSSYARFRNVRVGVKHE
ncbi:TldD/PmbA family protein [Caldisericum exile]|uniref:Peptidase U62 family protein n=1 Tax=Caldisericum exile (strain DSM 21853 / NBRC 104410 / AZM16c01) TaxID=511051 RepID=A0A7U6GFZ2_CALEA|nr:TldD/PmbA family protein [Caldisericum exile]BAL81612.1 putative peptidase U62 family protein [Caldisericum exile AZM16c01]